MIGKNTVLPERDPNHVDPLRWKILVKLDIPKYKGSIVMPDTLKNGDTTRKISKGVITKVGSKVAEDGEFFVGDNIFLDPSLDIMSPQRCFTNQEDRYMLCDCSDIIAIVVREETHENASQEIVEASF